jgi:hypothetical protein
MMGDIMRSAFRRISFIVVLSIVLSGCTGAQGNLVSAAAMEELPDKVPESFHWGIQDANTRRYLMTVDPDSLPPEKRLEILILREMATVSNKQTLSQVIDRLWENHRDIRDLISHPEQREAFLCPLVEIYYLLSASQETMWQKETAERLYRESLCRIEPERLSGYALHFYTLALFINGKSHAALPFIHRLKALTRPPVFLKDVEMALGYTLPPGDPWTTAQLMVEICSICIEHRLGIPEETLKAAVLALKRVGKSGILRDILLPVLRQNPGMMMYAFAYLLEENDTKVITNPLNENSQKPSQISGNQAPGNLSFSRKQPISRINGRPGLRIEIQVIQATCGSAFIDPPLRTIANDLKSMVEFTRLHLIKQKSVDLNTRELAEFTVDPRQRVRIVPYSINPLTCRAEMTVTRDEREVFRTVIESVNGGSIVISGPRSRKEQLLLRITTFFADINACDQYYDNVAKEM